MSSDTIAPTDLISVSRTQYMAMSRSLELMQEKYSLACEKADRNKERLQQEMQYCNEKCNFLERDLEMARLDADKCMQKRDQACDSASEWKMRCNHTFMLLSRAVRKILRFTSDAVGIEDIIDVFNTIWELDTVGSNAPLGSNPLPYRKRDMLTKPLRDDGVRIMAWEDFESRIPSSFFDVFHVYLGGNDDDDDFIIEKKKKSPQKPTTTQAAADAHHPSPHHPRGAGEEPDLQHLDHKTAIYMKGQHGNLIGGSPGKAGGGANRGGGNAAAVGNAHGHADALDTTKAAERDEKDEVISRDAA